MSELAADLGTAVCLGLGRLGGDPSLCVDQAGRMALGYSLVLALAACVLGLLTIESARVSEFVRRAIAERVERGASQAGRTSSRSGRTGETR